MSRIRRKSLVFVILVLCLLTSLAWGHNVMFVSAVDDEFDEADALLITFLEGLGHDVNVVDDDLSEEDTEALAATMDLVVISETVNSGAIKNEITDINVPMVITEMYAWDEMGLATALVESPDCETVNINIVNSDHPLAVGLSGVVPIFSSLEGATFEDSEGIPRMASATAGAGATVIAQATLSDGETYDEIFVYEKDAPLAMAPADDSNQIAANMRICIGLDARSYQVWNDNAFDIWEAAVNYALKLQKPTHAYVPVPANGAVDVARDDVMLKWRPGRYAATHTIYLGTDFNDVNEATLEDDRGVLVAADQAERSVEVGTLDYGVTYYWRVDEANEAPDTTVFKGNVWSFTLVNHIVVDDFESYEDEYPTRIFDTWLDGWNNPEENGMVVGYAWSDDEIEEGEHYAERTIVNNGKQSMPLSYDTDMKVAEATLPLANAGLITDWTQDEVNALSLWFQGYAGPSGGYTEDNGTFTIEAAGADIWGEADQFHFVYKEMSGNISIVAHIDSVFDTGDGWAKAGIMIRDTLDPGARNTALFFTPEHGTRLQRRGVIDGEYLGTDEETLYAGDPNDPNTFPQWLKIERTGVVVRVYTSMNGNTWNDFPMARTYVNLTGSFYVGMAVTSHNSELITEAQISNVTITGSGSDGAWMNQNVGIVSNSGEDMYIVLNDEAAVYYQETDPNMPASPTQNDTWCNWVIPLQEFADQGVDLTNVESMILGVGTWGDSSSAGGSGELFIDDIRLYRPPVE